MPLLDTTLLTNSRGEPALGHEIRAEIHSSDAIDVVMAFVRWSGSGQVLLYTVRKREVSWGDEEVVAQALTARNKR